MGSSLYDFVTRLCGAPLQCLSLGKPYGGPRLLGKFPFLCGWQLGKKFLSYLSKKKKKILICDYLIKRDYSMVSWCCICRCSGEIVDLLLIHCSVVFELWSLIFMVFGVQWVLSEKVLDLLWGWWSRGPNSNIWNITPLYLMHTSGLLFQVLQIVTLFIRS